MALGMTNVKQSEARAVRTRRNIIHNKQAARMWGWRPSLCAALVVAMAQPSPASADRAGQDNKENSDRHYILQPGDVVTISVWKERDLQAEVLVRPDGGLSFPLAGEINAEGQTIDAVRSLIAERLKRYIPDPVVTVAIKAIGGNHIFVIGKVNRPGEFPFSRPVDVMQALSLAGGATPFAALNEIVILRRDNHAGQRVLRFRYGDIARGRSLEQNVLLESGDTVVVP
jgi:polysaccharide export outer membrane protein